MWQRVRSATKRLFRAAAYMAGMSTSNNRLTDIPADFTDLVAAHPQVPDFAWPIMLGYAPKKAHAPGAWTATRELLAVRTDDVDVRADGVQVMVWEGRPRLVVLPREVV